MAVTADAVMTPGNLVRNEVHDRTVTKLANGSVMSASQLQGFIARNKKMIIYDGLGDTVINPYAKIELFKQIANSNGGYSVLARSMRLFAVPDMHHCFGGPSPANFDTLTAIENWVEKGQPPTSIIATKYKNNDPTQAPTRTMPLCPFPAKARYSGSGDVNDAANWSCPLDDQSLLLRGTSGVAAGLSQ
ncbi:hypothetical protein AWV79_02385 [Cupriavidus sp. UYMMa02A]|nr:hypothetical protein AWV79_02385 [Cupriavidus sp. UYMMa02A]